MYWSYSLVPLMTTILISRVFWSGLGKSIIHLTKRRVSWEEYTMGFLCPRILFHQWKTSWLKIYIKKTSMCWRTKIDNAFGVLRFLKRFSYESPETAYIVWGGLKEAIENAISAVEDLDHDEVEPIQRAEVDVVYRVVWWWWRRRRTTVVVVVAQ